MFRRHITISLVLTLMLAFVAIPASSQEDGRSSFGEVIDVRVINLEVVVTDKQGNRVNGLQPDDFELEVDGTRVPIDYFSEVVGGVAAPTGAAPLEATTLPTLAAGEPVPTRYLVYVDDYYTIGAQRNQVLENLKDRVALLGPKDSMAVVAFDGKRLDMLTSWTSSKSELERALDAAAARPALGMFRQSERQRLGLASLPDPGRVYAEMVVEVDAIISTLRGFAQPDGRKVMLLLGGAWPIRLDDDVLTESFRLTEMEAGGAGASGSPGVGTDENPFLREALGSSQFLALDDDRQSDLDVLAAITDTANLLGYTIYPLDVPANRNSGADARVDPLADGSGGQAGALGGLAGDLERQGSLRFMARETGGRALLGGDRLNALETVVEDTRTYYWLGFNADRQGDDEDRRVRITTKNEDFKIRSRRNYRDLSRTAEVTMLVQSALLFGEPEIFAPPSSLGARPGEAKKIKGGRMEVPIYVEVPVGELTALPDADGWTINAELRIAAIDETGGQSAVPMIPLRLRTPEQPVKGAMVRYETTVKLRRLPHDFVVSLHDPTSGTVLLSSFKVEAP